MVSDNKKTKIDKSEKSKFNRVVRDPNDPLEIDYMRGYQTTASSNILYFASIFFTAGLILLVFHWVPRWGIKLRFKETTLSNANYVYVKSNDKKYELCKVNTVSIGKELAISGVDKVDKYIEFKFTRLFYQIDKDLFIRPEAKVMYSRDEIAEISKTGLSSSEHRKGRDLFGANLISVPLKSIPVLLLDEVLHPFFIFQIYSIILWCTEQYYVYAGAILFIALVSAGFTLRETRNNLIRLNEIATYKCDVNVLRDGQFKMVSSDSLVPGDIIELSKSLILPCDFCLLSGTIILNESMLTGESIPVTKYSLEECSGDQLSVDPNVNKRCAISGGTMVVKTQAKNKESKILAMVTKTSWLTTKGSLVLSMLYPKESHFKFFQQSIKFLLVLCSIALVGFGVSVWRLLLAGKTHSEVVVEALDLITIVVPPALPMAQSVGTGFSIIRLKAKQIFCISPPRVSMAGKVEVYCFDKTGTLTEDGLDLMCVLPSNKQNFSDEVVDISRMNGPLFLTMATCHTLAHIDGKVSGDPLEEKIFEATKAELDDHDSNGVQGEIVYPICTNDVEQSSDIALVERFEFQSALQRMSVVVRGINKQNGQTTSKDLAIVKGSPEMIKRLSVPESIPSDFDHILSNYTKKGYRVLGCGYKEWDPTNSIGKTKDEVRSLVESELYFTGFVIMENKIKAETPGALKVLKDANIRIIMVTGDNVLTAVSVSRDCGLIEKDKTIFMSELVNDSIDGPTIKWTDVTHAEGTIPYQLDSGTLTCDANDNFSLAVTGDVWKVFYEKYKVAGPSISFNQILKKGQVFARMTPDQKQNLVEELQNLKLYVGMCGDGANDCGALKAAHVGISLSLAEASIAAPFTSTITNVSCTHNLIREGRASLTVSFKLFQFIGMYSLIQFSQVILLYFDGSVLNNYQYLYQDLWVIFPLVIFMGRTEPCNKLANKRPSSRLISSTVIGSLLGHVTLTFVFQLIVYILVRRNSWYIHPSEHSLSSYEGPNGVAEVRLDELLASLFVYGNIQYSIMCFIYSWGKPFLKPIYTNYTFFIFFIITLSTSLLLLLLHVRIHFFGTTWLVDLDIIWRVKLLALAVGNAIASMCVESMIIVYRQKRSKEKRKKKALMDSNPVLLAKNTINNQYTSLN
ncbi:hypothetical protein DICPUDRAFT_48233 [Dictyostelium purpureum]|uniref:Cation-transporting ATPase n=1 Tax=Dictyostelium purpureum TaxID=5786 RepID=F0ZNC4_DICPU|nr:uncharacterized protein DICPUDRAFT_48233 [Dictyostelium purpureum]EGC34539.1 hypothetical protein DICPUDRAFT_48233 [Dictyostelium purpureum]|eukprot:XP_003288915.1 hypothetical protein DICPUDRAFT_48233 [Dictyostelium purpureum]